MSTSHENRENERTDEQVADKPKKGDSSATKNSIVTKESIVAEDRLIVVFQPHTFSRTKLLFEEFVSVLRPIKNLVIYATFPAREAYDEEGCARRLAVAIGHAVYADNAFVLEEYLRSNVKQGDTVLFLGAGDIYSIAQYLTRK